METLDHLAGDWKIYQLKGGHRFSADDVLTAWTAAKANPKADRILDLGSGIGSIGLLALYRLPQARLLGVEVQSMSLQLALKTIAHNGLEDRVEFRLGDLRDPEVLSDAGKFPLITASPPYFPVGKATASPHPQRAAARMELHGDVFDYCRCAARHLDLEGRFVFIHSARDERPEKAISSAGLRLLRRQDVYFRSHIPPTVSVFSCGWPAFPHHIARDEPFYLRDHKGRWTQAYIDMREEMGTKGLRA